MQLSKTILGACVFSIGIAAAASSYHVKIYDPTWVGQTELKPGEYEVKVEGDKVTFKMGKNLTVFTAKVETSPSKFSSTQLGTKVENGHAKLDELDLGGTTSKIVMTDASTVDVAGTH